MEIHQLVYQSMATVPMTSSQLLDLLQAWRLHNHSLNVTGLLLYSDAYILQVLEGEAQAVQHLYQHIARDRRHYDVITLANGPVASRAFPEWSMGFTVLDEARLNKLAGYINPEQVETVMTRQGTAWPELVGVLQEFVALQKMQ